MTDVEKVARAIMVAQHGRCLVKDWQAERVDNPWVDGALRHARAAMAATRRIDAEALHKMYRQQNGQPAATGLYQAAGWLEARAKEVRRGGCECDCDDSDAGDGEEHPYDPASRVNTMYLDTELPGADGDYALAERARNGGWLPAPPPASEGEG